VKIHLLQCYLSQEYEMLLSKKIVFFLQRFQINLTIADFAILLLQELFIIPTAEVFII